jgi:hypothetical protein
VQHSTRPPRPRTERHLPTRSPSARPTYAARRAWDRAVETLEAAERRVVRDAPGDLELHARILGQVGLHLFRGPRRLALLERCAALEARAGTRTQAAALRWLASCHADLWNLSWASTLAERAAALAPTPDEEARCLMVLGLYRTAEQRFDEAGAVLDAAAGIGHHDDDLQVRCAQALRAHYLGRMDEARAGYEVAFSEPWRFNIGRGAKLRVFAAVARGGAAGAAILDEIEPDLVAMGLGVLAAAGREALGGGVTEQLRAEVAGVESFSLRLLLAMSGPEVEVAADGAWFRRRGSERVELGRRAVLQRLLATLAAAGPGGAVGRDALVAAVWPGERMTDASADSRLYVAVNTLRRLGLGTSLQTADGALAYGLATDVRVGVARPLGRP